MTNQQPKTFNESIEELQQALRQIGAVYVESIKPLAQGLRKATAPIGKFRQDLVEQIGKKKK